MAKKSNIVQFKGFRAEADDENEDQRFAFDRLEFSARPKWLDDLMNAGRINIGYAPRKAGDTLPIRALVYHAPGSWHPVAIEVDAYLIDLGGGTARIVDRASFEAVSKALG